MSLLAAAQASALPIEPEEHARSDAATLTKYRHLAYAESNTPTIWWLSGKKYGAIDGDTSLLWETGAIKLSRGTTMVTGGYRVRVLEIYFWFAPGSSDILEEWDNPYTGKTVQFRISPSQPSTHIIDSTRIRETTNTRRGALHKSVWIKPPRQSGTLVWQDVDEELVLVETAANQTQKTTRITEHTSFSADISDFQDGVGYRKARCDLDLRSDWPTNLEMEGYAGGTFTRVQGQKVPSLKVLPDRFLKALKQHHPDVMKLGPAVLDG